MAGGIATNRAAQVAAAAELIQYTSAARSNAMQWPLVPYKLQGPVPLRDHPEVAVIMETAEDRNLSCVVEPGLVMRITDITDAWMVSFNETDGVQTFHEANGCGWVWRAHQLEDFILHLKGRRVSVRKPAPIFNARG